MDMQLLREDWEALAGRRLEFTRSFYERLFARYPRYRSMFPQEMDTQMEKMVEVISGVVRFADHSDLIRPYVVNTGFAHRRLEIVAWDVENFKEVFIETLAELCAEWWNPQHNAAWHAVFEDMILPLFTEGLETGKRKRA